MLGSSRFVEASSSQAKATSPTAAGQRPSRAGYASGSGAATPSRPATQPAPRATARHGLMAANTSPTTRGEHGHADPEGDVDQRRQEVRGPGLHAGEARVDAHREDRHAEGAGQDLERHRDAQDDPLACVLEPWPRPERGEGDEGDDEHDGRPPGEEPAREGQVLAAHDAVRLRGPRRQQRGRERGRRDERRPPPHGVTSSRAICVSVPCSSTSKRPSSVARRSKRVRRPGVSSRSTS